MARGKTRSSRRLQAAISSTPTQSPLFKLPAELRNTVYRLVLTGEGPLTVKKDEIGNLMALLRTCKQTREEASSIFYSENRFIFPLDGRSIDAGLEWLKGLGRNAAMIRALVVNIPESDLGVRVIEQTFGSAERWEKSTMADAPISKKSPWYRVLVIKQALAGAFRGRAGLMPNEIAFQPTGGHGFRRV